MNPNVPVCARQPSGNVFQAPQRNKRFAAALMPDSPQSTDKTIDAVVNHQRSRSRVEKFQGPLLRSSTVADHSLALPMKRSGNRIPNYKRNHIHRSRRQKH
jgi:hypothetical protein